MAKIKTDLVDLGRLRSQDVSAKAADIRERYLVKDRYDEKVRINSGVRAERDGIVAESDRDVEARDKEVEENRRLGTINAEYVKNVSDNQIFAGKCAFTLSQVAEFSGRIEDLCIAADELNEILDDVHNNGNYMADSKAEANMVGVTLGLYKAS